MKKNHGIGGKFAPGHTTLIDATVPFVKALRDAPETKRVVIGYIKAGLRSPRGPARVKISDESGGVKLFVRGNTSCQEIRVISSDVEKTKERVARLAEDIGYRVSSEKKAGGS